MQGVHIFRVDLHGCFDGVGVALGDDADLADVADGDAFKSDGGAYLDAGGVVEVGTELCLVGEGSSRGAGHEEDQPNEHSNGYENQCTHSQL